MNFNDEKPIPARLSYRVRQTLDQMLHQAGPEPVIPLSTILKTANIGLDDGMTRSDVAQVMETYEIMRWVGLEELNGEPTIVKVRPIYFTKSPMFLGEDIEERRRSQERRRRLKAEAEELGDTARSLGIDPDTPEEDESQLIQKVNDLGIVVVDFFPDDLSNCWFSLVQLKNDPSKRARGFGRGRCPALAYATARCYIEHLKPRSNGLHSD